MADQYSPQHFFRKTPYELLARYFETKGVSLEVNWEELKGRKGIETLYKAFSTLPEEQLAPIEVDFQNINALACEGGIRALINEAYFEENENFLEGIRAIDGLHAKSIWAFLHKSDYWLAASSLLHAENISPGAWRKLPDIPPASPHIEPEDIAQFEKAISRYFYDKECKGRRCKVEPYQHVESGKEYFFAYPEGYGRLGIEW